MSSINVERCPSAVVYPSSTEDVSKIAKICHKYRVPMSEYRSDMGGLVANLIIVPFSGGTSLEGNFASPYGGISVDFSHMDQILELHADEFV